MEYYSAIQKREVLPFAAILMNFEGTGASLMA